MKEAEEYHHHCVVDQADWSAVDKLLALRDITPQTVSAEEFALQRSHFAHGNSGVPIIGDPDHVAQEADRAERARASPASRCRSSTTPTSCRIFRAEVLPRLERARGLRVLSA